MDMLLDLVARAEAGRGQVVGIVGESGIGKSRLLRELRRRLGGRGVTVAANQPDEAATHLARARDLFTRTGSPHELARTRGQVLQADIGQSPSAAPRGDDGDLFAGLRPEVEGGGQVAGSATASRARASGPPHIAAGFVPQDCWHGLRCFGEGPVERRSSGAASG